MTRSAVLAKITASLVAAAIALTTHAQVFNTPQQLPATVSMCSFGFAPIGSHLSLTNQFTYAGYQATITHVNGAMNLPFTVAPGGYDGWGGHLYSTNGAIQIKFQSAQRRFGGYFQPHAPTVAQRPTKVFMVFLKNNQLVGTPMVRNLSATGWTWVGYDVGLVGGFDTVAIFSNSTLKQACLRMDFLAVTKS
jgi:hypothetical protein